MQASLVCMGLVATWHGNLPRAESEPVSPELAGELLTTGTPGNSVCVCVCERERERDIGSVGHIETDQDAIPVITFSKIAHLTGLPTFYTRNGNFQCLRNRA